MFLGNPKSQVLTDPQSMNSYNYANGNPITKSDPNGKAIALAPVMYGLGDFGLASTVEFWGPPVAIGAGAAVAAIGAYSLAQNIYPGPGMNYQTYKLATENSYRTDPEPNGNWKGPLGIGIIGIGAWSLLNDKSNAGVGGQDGPTNLDWMSAIYQKLRGGVASQSSGVSTGISANALALVQKANIQQAFSSFNSKQSYSAASLPSNNGSGYGTSGSVYTNYMPASTHTACGSFCR